MAGTRSIPTRVGNTNPACVYTARRRGPSPRVWGIRILRTSFQVLLRSIPTRVGNTRCSPKSPARFWVHPHACGEYGTPAATDWFMVGPSPRVWGIRACANSSTDSLTVHPHACGEYGRSKNPLYL